MENLKRIQTDLEDAKKAWIDTAMENRMVIPEPEELSMNQYCTALLAYGVGRHNVTRMIIGMVPLLV